VLKLNSFHLYLVLTMCINLVKFTEIHLSRLIHLTINLNFVRHENLLKLQSIKPQRYQVSDTKIPHPAYMFNDRE